MSALGRIAGGIGGLFGLLLVYVFVGLIASCVIVLAIWPGEVTLLAPVLCTDAQPEAFVVTDSYRSGPGETSTDFTMYCMGPRGDVTDIGFMKPFLMISAINGAVLLIPILLVIAAARIALGGPGSGDGRADVPAHGVEPDDDWRNRPPPGSTAGPFVD